MYADVYPISVVPDAGVFRSHCIYHVADRQIVLDWLQSYRNEIRQKHPYRLTMFHDANREYLLDIMPAQDPKGAITNALRIGQALQHQGSIRVSTMPENDER